MRVRVGVDAPANAQQSQEIETNQNTRQWRAEKNVNEDYFSLILSLEIVSSSHHSYCSALVSSFFHVMKFLSLYNEGMIHRERNR